MRSAGTAPRAQTFRRVVLERGSWYTSQVNDPNTVTAGMMVRSTGLMVVDGYAENAAEITKMTPNAPRGRSSGVECHSGGRHRTSRHTAPPKRSGNPIVAWPAEYSAIVTIATHRVYVS